MRSLRAFNNGEFNEFFKWQIVLHVKETKIVTSENI
jgi:hypothetical protein